MKKNVIEMSENVRNVRDHLLVDVQDINLNARKFQKTAQELEKEAAKRNFWAFSPKCMLMGGGIGGVGAILFFLLKALIK